ncbi:kinase-like domain-containing protein [Favolaschia claudopus]|uniref:Kinase-like domain-containing protein n=1 Tax=Favolaschia claudopus TaxID=2862362 RepID=A0AAW0BPW4_9AGAR
MSSDSHLVQLIDSLAHKSSHSENADGVHVKTFDDPGILMLPESFRLGLYPWNSAFHLQSRSASQRLPTVISNNTSWPIQTPPLPLRIQWIRQIAEGLEFIHSRDIFWADCTPANMLLMDDLAIVLCDFEGSVTITQRTRVVLPDRYMKPDADFGGDYFRGPKVDVYAFGCVMLEILTHGVANVENRDACTQYESETQSSANAE